MSSDTASVPSPTLAPHDTGHKDGSRKISRKKSPASTSPTATLQAASLTQGNEGTDSPFAQVLKTATKSSSLSVPGASIGQGSIQLPPNSKKNGDGTVPGPDTVAGGSTFADAFAARGFNSDDRSSKLAQPTLVVEDMSDVLARLKAKTAARAKKSAKSKQSSTADVTADTTRDTTSNSASTTTKKTHRSSSKHATAAVTSNGDHSRAMSTSSKPSSSASKLPPPPLPAPGSASDAKDIKRSRRRKSKKAAQDDNVTIEPSSEDESGPLLAKISRSAQEPLDFNEEVQKLFESQRASPEALAARQQLIDELEHYFNNDGFRWGHPHSKHKNPIRIEAFGSVRFGLATSTSDLDLCMFDPYRPNGFEDKYFSLSREYLKRLPDIYDMRVVARKLYFAGVQQVQAIPTAGVPIVKFEVKIGDQRIQADINTNERLGVLNSRLINAYCELHPFIRPLCVLVKFYCKQRNLNDPSGAKGPVTFSSYTLIVMVIAYLQTINFVPNLQDFGLIVEHGVEPQRFFSTPRVRYRRNKMVKVVRSVGWDVTFVEDLRQPEDWARPDEAASLDLKQLARGFFDYYGERFDPTREIVAIQNGAPRARERAYMDPYQKAGQGDNDAEGAAKAEAQQSEDKNGEAEGEGDIEIVPIGVLPASATVEQDSTASTAKDPATDDCDLSPEEIKRQQDEDAFLEAYAEDRRQVEARAQVQAQAQVQDSSTSVEGEAHVQPDEHDGAEAEVTLTSGPGDDLSEGADARLDEMDHLSRGSSPIAFTDFIEPTRWSQRLMIVQDPFDLTRNTANNVDSDIVEFLRSQFRRARDMIDDGESIAQICASIKHEAGYLSLADQRQAWRKQRKLVDANQKLRNDDIIRSAKREINNAASKDKGKSKNKGKGKASVLTSAADTVADTAADEMTMERMTSVSEDRDLDQDRDEPAAPARRIFHDRSSDDDGTDDDDDDDEGLPDEAWMLEGTKKLGLK